LEYPPRVRLFEEVGDLALNHAARLFEFPRRSVRFAFQPQDLSVLPVVHDHVGHLVGGRALRLSAQLFCPGSKGAIGGWRRSKWLVGLMIRVLATGYDENPTQENQ